MNVETLKNIFGEWPLRVGEFYKVSYVQFREDWLITFTKPQDEYLYNERIISEIYDNLNLPIRSTTGSGDYDFFSPLSFKLDPNESIMIPTGIRAKMIPGFKLAFYPRSGLGSKYFMRIANTIPQIDSDYFYSDNEGHIFIRIRNEGDKRIDIKKGDKFVQASFEIYGITNNDHADGIRNGGFGSTGA